MAPERDYLTEEEAARLWSRAAQLQAEAAEKAERALPAGSEDGTDGPTPSGYELEHVVAAAAEAGIGEEFLEAALVDLRAERAIAAGQKRRTLGVSKALLGNPSDAITARRAIQAAPRDVLSAMEEVLPEEPYRLSLRDRLGDPSRRGALVFDVEGAGFSSAGQPGLAGAASWADFRQVIATVSERETDPPRCEVVVHAPVAWAMNLNAGVGALFVGGGAFISGLLGMAIGSAIVGAVTGGLGIALGWAVLGLSSAGGGIGSLRGYQAIYRYSLGRGQAALEGMLAAVAAEAEGGWGFAPPEPPALPSTPEDAP